MVTDGFFFEDDTAFLLQLDTRFVPVPIALDEGRFYFLSHAYIRTQARGHKKGHDLKPDLP